CLPGRPHRPWCWPARKSTGEAICGGSRSWLRPRNYLCSETFCGVDHSLYSESEPRQDKIVFFKSAADLARDRQRRAVAAVALAGIKRIVGGAQQLGAIAAVVRIDRHPAGNADLGGHARQL